MKLADDVSFSFFVFCFCVLFLCFVSVSCFYVLFLCFLCFEQNPVKKLEASLS